MRTLVLCGLLFSLLGTTLSAQALQDSEGRVEFSPDFRSSGALHYCQDSEGLVKAQNVECEPDKTEVSSISTIRNGYPVHAPLGATLETWNPDAQSAALLRQRQPNTSATKPDTPAVTPDALAQYKALRSQVAILFVVSLIVSVIAAIRGRSGVMTFLVCILGGFLLSSMITAAGNGVGGTAALLGSLAVPAIMLIRALASDST
jgi:lipopolysaccharide export LptBFGC system permease protein LptF